METIELRDALALMESGQPFSMKAVKYDRNRKTGGEFMLFHNVKFLSKQSTTGTIKVQISSGEVRSIHQRLILIFNNKTVIW